MLGTYFSADRQSHVSLLIGALGLSKTQQNQLRQVLDAALTDAFYTMLLALDGEASLGGSQGELVLADASGNRLSGSLEAPAWAHFHGERSET